MTRKRVCLVLGLALLAMAATFLLGGEGLPAEAARLNSASGAEVAAQAKVYLPVVLRQYQQPVSVPVLGVVMPGEINDANGLSVMKDAGADMAVTLLYWSAVEWTKGVFDWSSFDAKARSAQTAGIDLFVLVTGNPPWAAELPGGPVYNWQDLVNFVSKMVERYDCDGKADAPGRPCVRNWSFYAEPDNGDIARAQDFTGYWGHNGAGYAEMLYNISPAIHGSDPQAKVFNGGIAYDWFEQDGGPFVRSFLSDMLAALNRYPGGASAYLDGVAFHYYPNATFRWPTIREKAQEIRDILASHGLGDMPWACPEVGYWSSPKYNSTEQGQANWLLQTYARGLAMGLRPVAWYEVFDRAVPQSSEDTAPDRTSGLLRKDGSKKPSYFAYQTMTRELAGMSYAYEFGATGTEGYVFSRPDGRQKTVLWSQAGEVRVAFPYARIRLVTVGGQASEIVDGGTGDLDGAQNGQIELQFSENQPKYVEPK